MVRSALLAKPWIRRGLLVLGLALVPCLWKLVLLEGPALTHLGQGAPPALFRFHAHGLVLSELGYPRDLEGTVPAPHPGSNPSAQLQLMGWWDGRAWTAKALAQGRLSGRDLKVRLGHLTLTDVQEVTPARDYNGPSMCQVDYRVRWELPQDQAEPFRVQALVGLRLPPGLRMPGQELAQQVTLERTALGWRVQEASQVRHSAAGVGRTRWAWLRWLL